MRINIAPVTAVLLSLAMAAGTGRTQEIQVSLDEAGTLSRIDAELERDLGLFPEYENFREAWLFRVAEGEFVLEILHGHEGALRKVRLPLSAEEVRELRREVTARIEERAPGVLFDRTGRTKLLITTTLLSLGYYGWALPVVFDVGGKGGAALYFMTSGAGFFVPRAATERIPVTDAAATLALYGATRGIAHGICLDYVFRGEDVGGRDAIAFGMVASVVEGVAGFSVANQLDMTPGTAEVISVMGDAGLGFGLLTADVAGFFDDGEEKSRQAAASALFGSGVGVAAGGMLSRMEPYTRDDAYVLRAAGLLGAYLPLALVDIADPENDKAYTAASMAGLAIGHGIGHYLVRDKDFGSGQGMMVTLGEVAGGLFGLGLAHLAATEGRDHSTLYLTASSIGATIGFWSMYRSVAPAAHAREGSVVWEIDLAPQGVIALARGGAVGADRRSPVPLLGWTIRF
ncbi:hypothetical protein AMJ39_01740 [candidate division TA06 bacterium DG_24]|uniref:Ammonium transporter AmtB-like domain-containing protein n=2 Tax=Bacteria division TA06 TaxID=1156500 RepID=A0A0S8GET7_UNCT6|nr:MAG: hypothetical protein AMJ39_01740 [candidate division TA06 bacterium DG_24]KPK71592.1 MAG: hypothetical protein AMJ82_00470 [candidate division TA06 bacterium SM23_40]